MSAAERTFTVSTAVPSTADVNSCISISGERACANGSTPASASDFTATSMSVVFGTNETQKTVSIPTVLDTPSEGVEVVRIDIDYNPGTSDLGIFNAGNSQYTGRTRFVSSPNETATRLQINTFAEIDNETVLSISAPADANEGDAGTRDLTFTITQSETRITTTRFNVCFTGTATNDTATTGAISDAADYRPGITFNGSFIGLDSDGDGCIGGTVNTNDTGPSNPIVIRVKGDTDAESDETVIATLSLDGSHSGLTVFTSEATHTILDDDTPAPEISVAPDWALTPSGLTAGNKFRLLFVTSTGRNASATDIATYNTYVQNRAAAGHTDIQTHSAQFTVVGSTSSVDARDNTSTTGTGEPIYWLNGDKVADNYADFYDGSWDSYAKRNESGATMGDVTIWTGSNDNGTRSSDYLGHTNVQAGQLGSDPFTWAAGTNTTTRNFYGLSPVFTVAAATAAPEVSVRLMLAEGENRNTDDEVERPESDGTVSFPLSLDTAPAAALTVCVRVEESGDTDRVTSANEGIKTVSFMSGVQPGSIDVAWTDTNADDLDSVITVTAVPSSTAGCSSSDEYTVSSEHGAEKVRITDDEVTTLSLASSDREMGEGDAANTAVMTVTLGRALISGESVVANVALATSTGARLPDDGTPDFGVTATGTGVALSNQTSATPRLTFTGSDSNTVQTATVTLTPVANLDDPDADDETITATLSVLAGTGSGTVVTGGGVEVTQASSMVTLSIDDDEAVPAGTPGITLSTAGPLRLLETGSTTYTVVLDAAPTADVRVTMATIAGGLSNGDATAVNIPLELTFTTSDWNQPQMVTITGVDEAGAHRNRSLFVTHGGLSTDNRYGNLSGPNLRVNVDDAPELEAWFDYDRANGSVPFLKRPNTVVSSNGLTPDRNMYPGYELTYVLRLSNRPEPGSTVTVTASVPSDKQNLIGLSLTGPSDPLDGPAYQTWANGLPGTLTVEFKDRDPAAGTGCSNWHGGSEDEYHKGTGWHKVTTPGGKSETWDNTADTPWECWRKVWVVRKQASRNIANTCADITHTASGGGLRQVTVDTVRVHIFNADFTRARDCPKLTGNTLPAPQNSPAPAQAALAPTEVVANLQVTAVDDASASVSWDAVEHATSYDVSWSAESSDSLNASAGAETVTGTTATIQHDASVAMTLTVTVTPEYVDENGDTQQLDTLAGTATREVGPQPLNGGGTNGDGDGGEVNAGEGDAQASATAACVSAELLTDVETRITSSTSTAGAERWTQVRNALLGQPNAITLDEVKEIYDNRTRNGWSTDQWNPVIEALECIENANQQTPVPDATPDAVPDPGPDATPDPDPGPTPTPDPDPVPDPVACVSPQLRSDVEGYSKETWQGSAHVERWLRVLQTFSGTANDTTVMTPTEAEGYVNRGWQRWEPVLEALKCMEQQALDSS